MFASNRKSLARSLGLLIALTAFSLSGAARSATTSQVTFTAPATKGGKNTDNAPVAPPDDPIETATVADFAPPSFNDTSASTTIKQDDHKRDQRIGHNFEFVGATFLVWGLASHGAFQSSSAPKINSGNSPGFDPTYPGTGTLTTFVTTPPSTVAPVVYQLGVPLPVVRPDDPFRLGVPSKPGSGTGTSGSGTGAADNDVPPIPEPGELLVSGTLGATLLLGLALGRRQSVRRYRNA